MSEMPILMTYESWSNSQLSIVRFVGGLSINGKTYGLVADKDNKDTPDLLREDWMPIYTKLGRTKTIGLIKNGTSLEVAKQMIKAMNQKKSL